MFRLADPDTLYPTAVTVRVPHGDGFRDAECTLHYRVLPFDEAAELSREGTPAFVCAVVGDWSDIEGADGTALEFSADALAQLANLPYFAAAAVDAYYERFSPAKNS